MKKAALFLAVVLTVVLFGCDLPTSETADNPANTPEGLGGEIQEVPAGSTLFEADESEAEKILFETNEAAYKRRSGYTFWQQRGNLNTKDSGSALTVKLAKISGDTAGGYGFFFNEGAVQGFGNCMITVLIRKNGWFAVGKVIGTAYHNISWWQYSPYLAQGYGVENTLKVAWDSGKSEYVLSVKGVELKRFKDTEAPVCDGNGIGFIAVLTGQELFPSIPVKISYEIM